MRIPRTTVPLLLVILSTFPPAGAHEFWIEVSDWRPAAGDHVAVSLFVGEPFAGARVERRAGHLKQFALFGDARSEVVGRPGAEPAGLARPAASGLRTIAYESYGNLHSMSPSRFESYLRHVGIDPRALGFEPPLQGPVRERFVRCARALLDVGGTASGQDRPVGLPLELVSEENPYAGGLPDGVALRLLFDGRPLAGTLLVATEKDRPERRVTARTDAAGRARLAVDRAGTWLVTAVHVVPGRGAEAAWDSFWASLTFRVPRAPGVTPRRARVSLRR